MPHNYSDAMLQRLLEVVQRALSTNDPATRADFLAGVIQPYAGWALRWAIEDMRARGMSWTAIAKIVGRPHPTLLRQYQAGGPIYVHHGAHSQATRNFDAQTPFRRAATELAQRMAALIQQHPHAVTASYLAGRVAKLSKAQVVITDPEPMLQAAGVVLAAKRDLQKKVDRDAMPEPERGVWEMLDELDACFMRDRGEIRAAQKVRAAAGMLPKVDE